MFMKHTVDLSLQDENQQLGEEDHADQGYRVNGRIGRGCIMGGGQVGCSD